MNAIAQTSLAHTSNQSQVPQIPGAAIRYGRDFPSSQMLRDYPDLPVLQFIAYEIPADYAPDSHPEMSIGSGGIPSPDGTLGTLRFQMNDHQVYVLVNPADSVFRKCLAAWRAAGKVGIVCDLGDRNFVALPEIGQTFGRQLDVVANTNPISSSRFVRHAFALIGSGLLAAQATSDVETFSVLRSATAYLLVTKAVDRDAKALVEEIDARAQLAPQRSPSSAFH